jgi:hypothetical protein
MAKKSKATSGSVIAQPGTPAQTTTVVQPQVAGLDPIAAMMLSQGVETAPSKPAKGKTLEIQLGKNEQTVLEFCICDLQEKGAKNEKDGYGKDLRPQLEQQRIAESRKKMQYLSSINVAGMLTYSMGAVSGADVDKDKGKTVSAILMELQSIFGLDATKSYFKTENVFTMKGDVSNSLERFGLFQRFMTMKLTAQDKQDNPPLQSHATGWMLFFDYEPAVVCIKVGSGDKVTVLVQMDATLKPDVEQKLCLAVEKGWLKQSQGRLAVRSEGHAAAEKELAAREAKEREELEKTIREAAIKAA